MRPPTGARLTSAPEYLSPNPKTMTKKTKKTKKVTQKQVKAVTAKCLLVSDKAHKANLALYNAEKLYARTGKGWKLVLAAKAKYRKIDAYYSKLNRLWWKRSCDRCAGH